MDETGFRQVHIFRFWTDSEAEATMYVGEYWLGSQSLTHCPRWSTNITPGSIHFTPGQAYDECDNGNRSAVHWDMVKILAGDGELWFDDILIQKDGRFVHEPLLGLNPGD